MHRVFKLLISIQLLALGGLMGPTVLAQETPGEAIDPAECDVEPRPMEFFQQFATPQPGQSGAVVAASPAEGLPAGEPADEATADGVRATYRELVACLNAGDYLRIYALYTEDYVRRTLAEGGQQIQGLLATPTPGGEQERTRLVDVRDVRVIGDGRVGAIVETFDPAVGGVAEFAAVLVQSGDRYLIERETTIGAPETAGTPGATPGGENAAGAPIEVASYDIYFEPDGFTIPANTDVVVSLPNYGAALHNFAIDELGIDVDIQPGATEQVTINAPAGEYEYSCNVPGHKQAGMVGVLTVE